MLNKVFSEIGNVDARRDADVFLEILLSEGANRALPGNRSGKTNMRP
jgi:hypothetical protein